MQHEPSSRRPPSGSVRGLPADRAVTVREHLGLFKAASEYDVLDARGGLLLTCREPGLGLITRVLRLTKWKRHTPFNCEVRDPAGRLVLRVRRGASLLLSTVRVTDGMDRLVCTFEQKLLSWGPTFNICGPSGLPAGELRGSVLAFDFDVTYQNAVVARVSKEWRSLGVELFTSADAYGIAFAADLPPDAPARAVALAASLVVDYVLKE